MMSDLTKFFHRAYNEKIKLRFWFDDVNKYEDAINMYVKEVFADKNGNIEGLGLATEKDKNNKWEFYHWNNQVKFGYSDLDQDVVDHKKLPEDE